MDQLRFDGQAVIVTGAGGSLGSAHAHFLAGRGAKVLVNDIAEDRAQEVVEEITRNGGEAVVNTDSVSTGEGTVGIVEQALDSFGRLDAIVHNAGINGGPGGPALIEGMKFEDYEAIVGVNLHGAYGLSLAAWPHMQRTGYGRILFITSYAGIQGHPVVSAYGAAKAGQIGLMRCLAIEGANHGIQVNCLGNSAFNTRARAAGPGAPSSGGDVYAQWRSTILRPEMVSPMVAFLIHPTCEVTGELFYTGGGHVDRIFLATTKGYTNLELTPEDVAEHYADIADEAGAYIWKTGYDGQYAWIQDIVAHGAPPYPGTPGNPPLKVLP